MAEMKRATRVAEEVRVELSQLLVEGVKDPHIGFVTVTDVEMSDDLRQARVFVSVYGPEGQVRRSLAALGRAASYLRRELGHRLRLRYTPELKFSQDESIARGARIETLLKKIEDGDVSDVTPAMAVTVPVDTGRTVESLGEHQLGPVVPAKRPERPRRGRSRAGRSSARSSRFKRGRS
jgi:ribosome-binding factor A